jgi:hypothetical protein
MINLYNKIRALFRRTPQKFQAADIEFAFTSGGIDYYHFKGSGFAKYYERYAAAVDMIWAFEHHKLTHQDFDIFLNTLDEYHNTGNLVEAARLSGNIRAIRSYCYHVPLLYNLASVWYFDQSENPYSLDKDYCESKIEHWQKDKATLAFFLSTPIAQYMPLVDTIEESFRNFTKQSLETQLAIYERHLSNLSEIENESATIKNLRKQMDRLRGFVPLAS